MKTRATTDATLPKSIMRIALGTATLLLIPFVAMQFSNDVVWTPLDFAFAGTLLFGTGLGYTLTTKNIPSTKNRVIVGGIFAAALLIVWVELAVGIFD